MNSTTYLTPFWIKDESGTSTNFTVKILNDGQSDTPQLTIYYSTDATNWSLLGNTVSGGTLSKNFSAGSKIYLSCTTNSWAKTTSTGSTAAANNNRIGASKNFSVGGNIMSLIYGTTFADNRKYTTFPDDSIAGIFGGLFYNQSIIDAGELVLPVTHSTSPLPASGTPITGPLYGCYRRMFENCTSLVNGPHIDLRDRGSLDLPYCFQRMFAACTSLLSLHINTVGANYRYNAMFDNNGGAQGGICYDYSGGPLSGAFPTNRWTRQIVISMYDGYDRVVDWYSSVSGRVYQVTADVNNIQTIIYLNEDVIPVDYSEPFYVENITNSAETLNIKKNISDAPTLTIEYSTDKINWSTLGTTSTTPLTLPLQSNDKIYLKCTTNQWNANIITGCSKVGGNIMSLLYGTKFADKTTFTGETQNQFYRLFLNNTILQDASNLLLPVINLYEESTTIYAINSNCYGQMFYGCSSLTLPPVLPATTLAHSCYSGMFLNCTSLTQAPTLPATKLAFECYHSMFSGCTALTQASALSATTLAEGCYENMFDGCTSLVNAPFINGKNLAYHCYNEMFIRCTSLKNVQTLTATIMAEGCYEAMFAGCNSLTTAPTINATTLARACFEYMFGNCTSLVNAPELNVAHLVVRCYYQMFKGCTSLNNIKCLATTNINTDKSTYEWLDNVSSTGTFTKATGITWPEGTSGIPSGWTVVEQ